eukprot:scaffold194581_cov18-Tisochrysis_lutea.AAC.2
MQITLVLQIGLVRNPFQSFSTPPGYAMAGSGAPSVPPGNEMSPAGYSGISGMPEGRKISA